MATVIVVQDSTVLPTHNTAIAATIDATHAVPTILVRVAMQQLTIVS